MNTIRIKSLNILEHVTRVDKALLLSRDFNLYNREKREKKEKKKKESENQKAGSSSSQ